MADVRLIDAIEAEMPYCPDTDYEIGYQNGLSMAKAIVIKFDAAPVVHGRWKETLVPDGYVQKASRLRKQCSVCGWTNACRYNYCPNCGAKMDLEVNNNG